MFIVPDTNIPILQRLDALMLEAWTFRAALPSRMLTLSCTIVWLAAMPLAPLHAEEDSTEESATEDFVAPADIDWSQLDTSATPFSKKALKVGPSTARSGDGMSWKRDDKNNGSSAVVLKQLVMPFWDTRVGADLNVVTQLPMTPAEAITQKILHDADKTQSSGSAWAAMTAPGVGSIWDKTTIEARMDPAQEQNKFGTSLEKAVPFGEQYALTLQNGYRVVQPTAPNLGHPARNYEVDQSAKLSVNTTGTSFVAGQSLSTTDDRWLRKVGAEQKLFGGISITGSVAQTPEGIANRSVGAGYKLNW